MSAFSRRGACPALSAPMQTGDGLLVRLNPVAGGMSPESLIGLAESALRHGNGIMEVTARGSLQIRGLTAQSAALLAAEVDALDIAVRTGVPVETGPLAGIDPQEIADPRPLAERIRAAIEEAGLVQRLRPKVSVVVDGCGQLAMDAVTADVRLAATRTDAGVRWRVSVAGDGRNC
ncbi:precorrin-3B synthase, partial [Mesorhizobium sp. M7A.F.Ca.CA.002.07.1.1]